MKKMSQMMIYNTQTRTKEPFIPLRECKATIYACGPTVYDFFHIGNARPLVIFDILRRHLKKQGYDVTFVRNFTDIDDKMINRAREEGVQVSELAERFIREFYTDAEGLGVSPADVHPRATEHIPEIISIVERIIENGYAYPVGGDVYFDTQAYPEYGKLTRQNLDNLEAGARVDIGESKRHPTDFALWKTQKPGEPAWESPWGMGRPGWHIECSAMATKYLGDTIDIHCGGEDLIFPHHENELAQTESATGKPFVRYWMHNGLLNIDNKKMSKSLGNFFTVREIAAAYDLEVVRLFLLSSHYRSPINYTSDLLDGTKSALERLYNAKDSWSFMLEGLSAETMSSDTESVFIGRSVEARKRFDEAMNDDLNTADASGVLFEFVRDANTLFASAVSKKSLEAALALLDDLTDTLGLLYGKNKKDDDIPEAVTALLDKRQDARARKDFAESDRIRDELKALGYIVEDTPHGQKLKRG